MLKPLEGAIQQDTVTVECNQARDIVFSNAIAIAKTVVRMLAHQCEIAIHDFSDLEHSLVHIEGNITGRKIGAPITNIVVKAWRQYGDNVEDIVAYPSTASSGRRLKSSTTFLRDKNKKVVGAFCLNLNITDFESMRNILQNFIHMDVNSEHEPKEAFAFSSGETSDAIIETSIAKAGKHPSAMDREERIRFIQILDSEGAFLIKGMVHSVSSIMNVSIYTVYNYMRHVKAHHLE